MMTFALTKRWLTGCAAGLLVALLPADDSGRAPAILQDLHALATTGTVLHIGAHPDDENTELITWLSLGRGYRAAYLSITRGDGGQNELGKDFDEKLGVLRTQELLAARRLDHGRQFFTRAIDFGFSKSPEEALRLWDHDAILGDVVRVIRTFRPDVIVTRFPIPPGSGGHGQHTASAILAVEAFKLAADPAAYPEQIAEGLTPWQAKRVLWNAFRFGSALGPLDRPVITQDIAGVDASTAETFSAIAARSRAMHKSQGLGEFRSRNPTGPNQQNFMILAGDAPVADLMDGVATPWNRDQGGAEIDENIKALITGFKPDTLATSVPALLTLRSQFAKLPDDPLVTDKRKQLDAIIQACLGLKVLTTIANADVVPGEPVTLHFSYEIAASDVSVRYIETRSPALRLIAGKSGELTGTLRNDTPLTQPYWLRAEGTAGISRVDDPSLIGRPVNPPAIPLEHVFSVGGQTLTIADEPVQTMSAPTAVRAVLPISVIPPIYLSLSSDIYVVAPGASKQVTVEVTATRARTNGRLLLEVPAGWSVNTGPQDFRLPHAGDKARFTFSLTAPPAGGTGRLGAVAELDGRTWSSRRITLDYAHLPVQLLQPPARARLTSFTLAIKGRTVGYLPGAGDSVSECMEQMGYIVRSLTGTDLTPEKLAGLDAVVIGVRAFNDRTDLKDAFPGLLAWVEAGGTVIAQYNRTDRPLRTPDLGPYPITLQEPAPRQRVTDENAPVTILVSDHAAVNTPNKIAPSDFDGWVQERGTYFPIKWDEDHYTAMLAMSDPGEAPLKGGLLIARHGKGHYVYTGVAFFRQLPAGVPGAYRLFANLLSLGK